MLNLKIFGAPPEVIDQLINADDDRIITPQSVCQRRGLSLADLPEGAIYVDRLLGLVICNELTMPKVEALTTFKTEQLQSFRNELLEIQLRQEVGAPTTQADVPWYVERLGGWPELRGNSQRIAIIDTGIAPSHPMLLRDPLTRDFASAMGARAQANDTNGHGTRCAGIIAAGASETRIGVAPDCRMVVGQVGSSDNPSVIATFDILSLLSWAIHCWNVRVVSISLTFAKADLTKFATANIFSWVAQRLREGNRALLFCAAGNQSGSLAQPAASDGVVAVSGYKPVGKGIQPIMEYSGFKTRPKKDFLLGPGTRVKTTDGASEITHTFEGTSAACAFAAGVAALYFEVFDRRRQPYSVEDVLEAMKGDAEKLRHPEFEDESLFCVCFPGGMPPTVDVNGGVV